MEPMVHDTSHTQEQVTFRAVLELLFHIGLTHLIHELTVVHSGKLPMIHVIQITSPYYLVASDILGGCTVICLTTIQAHNFLFLYAKITFIVLYTDAGGNYSFASFHSSNMYFFQATILMDFEQ
jgi:hypothetical protein